MDRTPTKNSPKLMEAVIQEMQLSLGESLAWLNHVFGLAERTSRDYNDNRQYYDKRQGIHEPWRETETSPSVYVGNGKYEQITPDSRDWGNYAFFYLDERQDLSSWSRVMPYFEIEGDVNLVVWGDLRDIESEDDRNLESVKSQVLQALGEMRLTSGRVGWSRVYEGKEVFDDFTNKDYLGLNTMWPYFAFRFEGEIRCNSGCVGS